MHENWRGWASIQNFQSNWNKFYQKMRRATDGPLYYCILPEHHRDNSLHIHLISTCEQDTRWFKDTGRGCGYGYKNENEPLGDTARAVQYVTKYVGKSLDVGDWPKNFRRIRFSVNWPEPPTDDTYSWQAIPATVARFTVKARFEQGYYPVNAISGKRMNYEPYLREDIRNRPIHDRADDE